MGKYKHEGKGRDISIGGGQERKDLFKDMSGGYNAMGDSNTPNYKYNGSVAQQRYSKGPLELTAEGKKKILASDANSEFKSAIAKQPVEMKGSNSPTYKTGCVSGSGSNAPYKLMGDPKKKLKGKINKLSGKHKKLYDAYEQGSKVDMDKLGRVEDKLEKKEKKYTKKYGSSPYNMIDNPTAKPKSKSKMQKEGRLKATMTKKMQKRGVAIGASAGVSAPKKALNKIKK